MTIISETTLENFEAWSGAIDTQNRIIEEGKANEFDALIEECYPNGLSDTQLNDILWFEEDWLFEMLGINKDEEDEEEEEQ